MDGVLVKGEKAIPRSTSALKILKQPLKTLNPVKFGHLDGAATLPFVLVTNGGSRMEDTHVKILNYKLKLQDDMPQEKI